MISSNFGFLIFLWNQSMAKWESPLSWTHAIKYYSTESTNSQPHRAWLCVGWVAELCVKPQGPASPSDTATCLWASRHQCYWLGCHFQVIPRNSLRQKFVPRRGRIASSLSKSLFPNRRHYFPFGIVFSFGIVTTTSTSWTQKPLAELI